MITIPAELKPRDGRFGSGPSKVPLAAVEALAGEGAGVLGTSHRRSPVRQLVGRIRAGLADLFGLPAGYEVLLGNGGSTAFWDAAAFGLIRSRASLLVCGEFSAKFATVVAGAPFLAEPSVTRVEYGTGGLLEPEPGVDAYAWPHNETSTGVVLPVHRVADDALMLVDGTSAAGAVPFDVGAVDAYYFAPQKAFGAEAGLWLALVSPAALDRIDEVGGSRWQPPSLDLRRAMENSALDQTYNTPAIASLWLLAHQVEWLLEQGGLAWAAARTRESSTHLYGWAESCPLATPFVADPSFRSPVVATIDFDPSVDASDLAATLRANGIVDTEPYRALGRNQLRIGLYPAVEPADVVALTACLDYLLARRA